ncbi:MAG: UDP-N-acetylglucosamine 2-epimerase (non-hydrolyzing) [Planctomycetaceae bacterium]|nr:UDP-N-acetylglucosamine 2-epimerase (non-hydrolyzing) [Planctomycetaceae bacterium]
MKLVVVCGARPNFMKIAPIMWAIQKRADMSAVLVHTGQHYDRKMSELFFEELRIPAPDVNLGVGSGSHAAQTADVMKKIEPILIEERPDATLVVGDVNSTVACALTSVKLGIPVAHVEAGLRSGDRSMPEEINRIVTDAISEWLFVSERSGLENLRREGIPDHRVHFVGNTMIDTLLSCRDQSDRSTILAELAVAPKKYAVLTLHRPSNVDDAEALGRLLVALRRIQEEVPVIFPVHPRTRAKLAEREDAKLPGLRLIDPLGYLDFMKLVSDAALVLTDSGGIQEETTVLGVPCLTLRDNTERPATVSEGTNVLVGRDPDRIFDAAMDSLRGPRPAGRVPELWDGGAAARVVEVVSKHKGTANKGVTSIVGRSEMQEFQQN